MKLMPRNSGGAQYSSSQSSSHHRRERVLTSSASNSSWRRGPPQPLGHPPSSMLTTRNLPRPPSHLSNFQMPDLLPPASGGTHENRSPNHFAISLYGPQHHEEDYDDNSETEFSMRTMSTFDENDILPAPVPSAHAASSHHTNHEQQRHQEDDRKPPASREGRSRLRGRDVRSRDIPHDHAPPMASNQHGSGSSVRSTSLPPRHRDTNRASHDVSSPRGRSSDRRPSVNIAVDTRPSRSESMNYRRRSISSSPRNRRRNPVTQDSQTLRSITNQDFAGRMEGGRAASVNSETASSTNQENSSPTKSIGSSSTAGRKKFGRLPRRPSFSKLRNKEGTIMQSLFGDVVEKKRPFMSQDSRQHSVSSMDGERMQERNLTRDVSGPSESSVSSEVVAASDEDGETSDGPYRRTLHTSSVYHNATTGLWIVTIDTGGISTSSKSARKDRLMAFAFTTEVEAKEAAMAYSTPTMIPYETQPRCHICHGKFAVFRRPAHCRNCGVCICSRQPCSLMWNAKRVPDSYNAKGRAKVRVCADCDVTSNGLRDAFLAADVDEVIRLHGLGNVNLRSCLGKVQATGSGSSGGEIMFPIHAAVMGGSLSLLRWLVDVRYCPIFLTRTGNNSASQSSRNAVRNEEMPILTSRGRSILSIAMTRKDVDILRYLVVEKGMSLYETKDVKVALACLDGALRKVRSVHGTGVEDDEENHTVNGGTRVILEGLHPHAESVVTNGGDRGGMNGQQDNFIVGNEQMFQEPAHMLQMRSSDESDDEGDGLAVEDIDDDDTVTTVADACIICYENSIDCVMTPCGHQICCLKCSSAITVCPVCNTACTCIRIFKP